jgi:ketosteroid isomerase-like protein
VSAEHPNATAYRATAAAFRAGELDTLATLIAEDVVWHIPGIHARDIVGIGALLTFLRGLAARGFRLEEHDVFGNHDHVRALSVMSVRQDGVEVSTRVVSVFHYRDGKQLERWFYPDDPAALETLFAKGT